MSSVLLWIEGEPFVTAEIVARGFGCEVAWVREVAEAGLLGEWRVVEETVAFDTAFLDRFARVHRLHVVEGLELEAITLVLVAV